MKKTVFLVLMITSACAFGQRTVFAQTGVSLEAEIQNMEKAVNKQGIQPEQRHETLVRLARLKQLSGDIEGAARNWLEAAAAIPGNVDDDALFACASCLAAMGEWDRARTALEPIVLKLQRARFLDACIKAIQSDDASALAALADNPQYSPMRNEIYFMLWKISSGQAAEGWRRKLLAEYPQSPEGRLAAGESSSTIIVKPSPFWFFASGLDSLPLTAETFTAAKPSSSVMPQNPTPVSAPVKESTPAPQVSVPAASVTAVKTPQSAAAQSNFTPQGSEPVQPDILSAGTEKLQTGLYSQQVNADAQMEKLRKAGFTPFLEKRNEKWAVMVPASQDQGRTIRELREAGFESFPVK